MQQLFQIGSCEPYHNHLGFCALGHSASWKILLQAGKCFPGIPITSKTMSSSAFIHNTDSLIELSESELHEVSGGLHPLAWNVLGCAVYEYIIGFVDGVKAGLADL